MPCGACEDRCVMDALKMEDGKLTYNDLFEVDVTLDAEDRYVLSGVAQ